MALPLPHCFAPLLCIANQENPVIIHSTVVNSCKGKNDIAKRGVYRKFDKASSQMRDSLIQSNAERVIAHAAFNSGSYHRGFAKEMVNELYQRAPFMGISCDNINIKVRII